MSERTSDPTTTEQTRRRFLYNAAAIGASVLGLSTLFEACAMQTPPNPSSPLSPNHQRYPSKGEEIPMTQSFNLVPGKKDAAFGVANDVQRTGVEISLAAYGWQGSAAQVTAKELELYWYADGQGGYLENSKHQVYDRTAEPQRPIPIEAYLLPRDVYSDPKGYDDMQATLDTIAGDPSRQVLLSVGVTNNQEGENPLIYLTNCQVAQPNPLP